MDGFLLSYIQRIRPARQETDRWQQYNRGKAVIEQHTANPKEYNRAISMLLKQLEL